MRAGHELPFGAALTPDAVSAAYRPSWWRLRWGRDRYEARARRLLVRTRGCYSQRSEAENVCVRE
jgi:hypothetical protein